MNFIGRFRVFKRTHFMSELFEKSIRTNRFNAFTCNYSLKSFNIVKRPLSYYAGMCNMSESNFRKIFKECTGKSPIEFRNMLRIEEAKKLIDSGEFTVEEAAWYVGFNNMSFFYELYRRSDQNEKNTDSIGVFPYLIYSE